MKNNKKVEKRIISSLEDKSPLNFNVLKKAKQEIRRNNKKTKLNYYLKRVAVASALVLLCIAIVLPIVLRPSLAKSCEYIEYRSMKEYFSQNDIDLKTYEEIKNEYHFEPSEGYTPDSDDEFYLYKITKCELIKYKNKDFCVAEYYNHTDGSKIENYVVLIDNYKLEKDLFSNFKNVENDIVIDGVEVQYGYDSVSKVGRSIFNYNGYKFYTSYYVENENDMISHLRKFINFQKV